MGRKYCVLEEFVICSRSVTTNYAHDLEIWHFYQILAESNSLKTANIFKQIISWKSTSPSRSIIELQTEILSNKFSFPQTHHPTPRGYYFPGQNEHRN